MKMGPVPMELYQERDALAPDFAEAIEIVPEKIVDFVRESVRPKRDFDDSHFTRRELRLMTELAERFRDDFSRPMIGVTHAERGPWAAIWDHGHGNLGRIPYALAIRDEDPNAEIIREAAAEVEAIRLAHVHGKAAYIAAVHQALDGDYSAMEHCFTRVIKRTLRISRGLA